MKTKGKMIYLLSFLFILLLVVNTVAFGQQERKVKMDEYRAQLTGVQAREAEANAQEDMKRREEVEIHIWADSMIRAAEWVMEERQGKLSKPHLQRIESAILELEEAVAEGDSGVIEERTKGLKELLDEM